MDYSYYDARINKNTRGRYDVTPLFADKTVFTNLVNDLVAPFSSQRIDKVAGIDALGFVLGAAIAQKLEVGFVALRKGGKLPGKKTIILTKSFTDYTKSKKSLEISTLTIKRGDCVLLVDEWIETGAQAKTAIALLERAGAKVVGIACLNAERRTTTELLFTKYNCKPIHSQLKNEYVT